MPIFHWPFVWGPTAPSTTTTPTTTTPDRWTTVTTGGGTWRGQRRNLLPRFEHVYPMVGVAFTRSVDFEYQVQTQYPFIIGAQNAVVIESSITKP